MILVRFSFLIRTFLKHCKALSTGKVLYKYYYYYYYYYYYFTDTAKIKYGIHFPHKPNTSLKGCDYATHFEKTFITVVNKHRN